MQRDPTVWGQHIVIGLFQHTIEIVQRQPLAEQFVTDTVNLKQSFQFNHTGYIGRFKAADGELKAFLHVCVDALCDEFVQVDGPSQQLNVSLLEQRFVAIIPRI